jgi:hypothetical protein
VWIQGSCRSSKQGPARACLSSYPIFIYRLKEIDGRRIADVVIEGVSMDANYRTQFDAEFTLGGVDSVRGAIRKSVSEP